MLNQKASLQQFLVILFWVFAELMYGFELTSITMPEAIHQILLMGTVFIFMVTVFKAKWNFSEILRSMLLLLMALLVYLSSGETLYLSLMMAAIVVHVGRYDLSMKTIFWTRLILTLIIIFLSLIGILPNKAYIISKGVFGVQVGYSLGYYHPNNLAQAIFMLVLLFLAINRDRLTNSKMFLLLTIDLATYLISKSKTVFFILTILLVLTWLVYKKRLKIKSIPTIIYVTAICLFFVLGSYWYSQVTGGLKKLLWSANGLFNYRLAHAASMFSALPLTLFGKIVDTNILQLQYGYNIVDDGYVFILFNYGIIGAIFIMFLYLYSINRLCKKRNYIFVLTIISFLTLATMENVIRTMAMNVTMIYWVEFIEGSKKSSYL